MEIQSEWYLYLNTWQPYALVTDFNLYIIRHYTHIKSILWCVWDTSEIIPCTFLLFIFFSFSGDVILREEPYAAVLESIFRVNHCAHCLRKTPTPIPCYECATVSFTNLHNIMSRNIHNLCLEISIKGNSNSLYLKDVTRFCFESQD